MPDPIGTVLSGGTQPNGLEITKVRVPLGVIGIIFEARPNVTSDAAALCLKAGNAVILRGGKEAKMCIRDSIYPECEAKIDECMYKTQKNVVRRWLLDEQKRVDLSLIHI